MELVNNNNNNNNPCGVARPPSGASTKGGTSPDCTRHPQIFEPRFTSSQELDL